MRWLGLRRARRLAMAWTVAGLAACGGGDRGPATAPDTDLGSLAGDYGLVIINGATVPTTQQAGSCDPIRFRQGGMTLGEDGTWRIVVKVFDAAGNPQELEDEGRFERADDALSFASDVYGDRFTGAIDAPLVHVYYNWCVAGESDIDFTFTR